MKYYGYKLSELEEVSFSDFWKLLSCIEPIEAEKIEYTLVAKSAMQTGEFDTIEEMKRYSKYIILPEKLSDETEKQIMEDNIKKFNKIRNM